MREFGVFYIGGASASGKSYTSKEIVKTNDQLVLIELDAIYNALSSLGEEERKEATQRVSIALVEILLEKKNSIVIVEGGWIEPNEAKQLKEKYKEDLEVIFCGYTEIDVASKIQNLKNSDSDHWIMGKGEQEATKWIQEQINGSVSYKGDSESSCLHYVDFSDQPKGGDQLKSIFKNWAQSEG